MAAIKDFNLASYSSGATVSYSADFWDTIRGAWADQVKMDYTGWSNIPTGARRFSVPSTGDILMYQRNGGGTDDTIFDSRNKANLAGATFTGKALTALKLLTFSATPTFDMSQGNVWEFGTITANVTTTVFSNATEGQAVNIRVKQNGTGGYTFAIPSGATVVGSIDTAANARSLLSGVYWNNASSPRWELAWSPL